MSEDDPDIVVFRAAFPPIKSAILVSGDGTGGSIKLEVPQTERAALHRLMDMCQDELIVTVARAKFKEILSDERESAWAEVDKRAARCPTDLARRRVHRPTD